MSANPHTRSRNKALAARHKEGSDLIEAALADHGRGDLEPAARRYAEVLQVQPDHALALHNLGVIRAGEGRTDEALALIGLAIEAEPASAGMYCSLGAVLAGAGRSGDAAAAFRQALALQPDSAAALTGLAEADAAEGRPDAARALYEQALAIDGHHTPALTGLGALLMGLGRPREAGERFALALALRPDSAPAHYNVANALKALARNAEAKVYFRQAVALSPRFADAWTNLGNLCRDEGDLDEALTCHLRAAELSPSSAVAHLNLGHVLRDRGDAEAARAAFQVAVALDPADVTAELCLTMAELPMAYRDQEEIAACRERYATRLGALIDRYAADPRPEAYAKAIGASQPFYLAYQGMDDRELQRRYGTFLCQVMGDRHPPAAIAGQPGPGERVRVAIVSGFFSAHSNWKIPIRGWVKQLDRTQFEVIGYHTGVRQDACTEEARALCDRLVHGPLSPERWRAAILEDQPHVLIYPEIGMDPTAVKLAAQRLAPLQCASWGHPDTSGLPTIDAFLSSDLMEPPEAQAHYSERLVRLPGLGVWLEPPAEAPEPLTRADLGCRPEATVFWCGQSLSKYLPRFDDIYPRIAERVGDCQFVFIGAAQRCEAEQVFLQRLDAAFAGYRLEGADHVVVLPRMNKAQFLGAIACADVILDSLEWSGCNSILESLGAGLPIVTHRGSFMRGRHAAALLETMGVVETVADTVEGYIELAASLAADPLARAAVGAKITANRTRIYRDDSSVRALEDVLLAAVRDPARHLARMIP